MAKASCGDEECWLIGGAEEERLVSICHFLYLDTPYRVRVHLLSHFLVLVVLY